MKSLGNIGGILYNKDTPIIEFKCERGQIKILKMLTDDLRILPIEFTTRATQRIALTEFLFDQVTPETRIGYNEVLASLPVQYYDVERMLRWFHGYMFGYPYWIKQDDDVTCWEDSPIEGIGVTPVENYASIPYNKDFL